MAHGPLPLSMGQFAYLLDAVTSPTPWAIMCLDKACYLSSYAIRTIGDPLTEKNRKAPFSHLFLSNFLPPLLGSKRPPQKMNAKLPLAPGFCRAGNPSKGPPVLKPRATPLEAFLRKEPPHLWPACLLHVARNCTVTQKPWSPRAPWGGKKPFCSQCWYQQWVSCSLWRGEAIRETRTCPKESLTGSHP